MARAVLATAAAPIEGCERVAEINPRAIAAALGLSKDTAAAALARLIGDEEPSVFEAMRLFE